MKEQVVEDGRVRVLHEVERTERLYRVGFFGAAAVEAVLLTSLLWIADMHDATHKLIIIGFVGSYSIVVLAIVALGAHVTRLAQRILRAVDLSHGQ